MSKLKIINTDVPTSDDILYIVNTGEEPELAYKSGGSEVRLNKGGSPRSRLLSCSGLKEVLSKYFIKGTKFIISTYNPTLCYLFPGDPTYDSQFNPENDFIPTLNISDLVRGEVDGFDKTGFSTDPSITQRSVRSMRVCDSWYNSPAESEAAEEAITERVNQIFGYYKEFDVDKEIDSELGDYGVDVSKESIVVNLISGTTYTDTINLEDWIYKSGKGLNSVSGKLDISFMYSIGEEIHGGMQTIKAFQYSGGNVIVDNTIMNLGSIQLEYINHILKIYPLNQDIDEVIINDCTLTIGVL